jgi:predicted TIM-barrel fold metal-dependent hydrolase
MKHEDHAHASALSCFRSSCFTFRLVTIDCHVHVSALRPEHGLMSPRIVRSIPFRFMQSRLGIHHTDGDEEATERAITVLLFKLLDETSELDAAAVLAFDAVYTEEGEFDPVNTHLYVKNDFVIDLAKRHKKVLFGASVHPYRKDAVAELERCIAAGAVLLKWLPLTQDINPADPRCIPFYECLAHHGLPLLSHTGGEKTLPNINTEVASPALLEEAVRRGVTIIAAHCGTRSALFEKDYVDVFARMAKEHEHFYGDTSALNLPTRSHAYKTIFEDPAVMAKVIHGSDWPVIPVPPLFRLGLSATAQMFHESNWLKRDVQIKQRLGFEKEYWERAAQVLKLRSRLHCETS